MFYGIFESYSNGLPRKVYQFDNEHNRINMILSSDTKPVYLEYIYNSEDEFYLCKECWYKNGQIHREDGPAQIEYVKGKVIKTIWKLKGKIVGYSYDEFREYVILHQKEYPEIYQKILKSEATTIFD